MSEKFTCSSSHKNQRSHLSGNKFFKDFFSQDEVTFPIYKNTFKEFIFFLNHGK